MAKKSGSNDTVTVRIPASTAKDLLYALEVALGSGLRGRSKGKGKDGGKDDDGGKNGKVGGKRATSTGKTAGGKR